MKVEVGGKIFEHLSVSRENGKLIFENYSLTPTTALWLAGELIVNARETILQNESQPTAEKQGELGAVSDTH